LSFIIIFTLLYSQNNLDYFSKTGFIYKTKEPYLKVSVVETFAVSGKEDVNLVMKGVTEENAGSVETA